MPYMEWALYFVKNEGQAHPDTSGQSSQRLSLPGSGCDLPGHSLALLC